jgi:hypothetical protein
MNVLLLAGREVLGGLGYVNGPPVVPGREHLPGLGFQAPGCDLGVAGLAGELGGGAQVGRRRVVAVQVDQGRGG